MAAVASNMSKGREQLFTRPMVKESCREAQQVHLPSVEGNVPDSPMQHPVHHELRMPTADEIERFQKQAYEEAHAEGFKKGREEGAAAGRQEIQQFGNQLKQLLSVLHEPFESLDDQVIDELTGMVIAIARHIIRREIKADPAHIVGVVREALNALPVARRHVRLFLNPDDARLVRDAMSVHNGESGWEIREDPAMSRGGCRVMTENSQIDATLESRLAAVVVQFLGDERGTD